MDDIKFEKLLKGGFAGLGLFLFMKLGYNSFNELDIPFKLLIIGVILMIIRVIYQLYKKSV